MLVASADLIRKLPAADPPDHLWDGIISEIESSEPAFIPRRRPLSWAIGLATAAVLAVMVWIAVKLPVRQMAAAKQLPASSGGLYVRAHLVATGQVPMLSAAPVEPMLQTSLWQKGGSEKE